MSNCQNTAVIFNSVRHFLLRPSQSHTKCPTPNMQQYIQFSTPHPADPLTHPDKCPTTNTQQYIKFGTSLLSEPLTFPQKCPNAHTKQDIHFSTPLHAHHLKLPHKMSNCQHTAIHKVQYATPCWPPSHSHTKCPTANTQQYIQFSITFLADTIANPQIMSNCQHTAVHKICTTHHADSLHIPTQNVQFPTHRSTYNSLRYFRLKPSHSHTKCPKTNTHQ